MLGARQPLTMRISPRIEAITAAGGKPAEAVALLALVAGQDVEPAEDSDGTDGRPASPAARRRIG